MTTESSQLTEYRNVLEFYAALSRPTRDLIMKEVLEFVDDLRLEVSKTDDNMSNLEVLKRLEPIMTMQILAIHQVNEEEAEICKPMKPSTT